jgi:hypothetical protein
MSINHRWFESARKPDFTGGDPSSRRLPRMRDQVAAWGLAGLLALASIAVVVKGISTAWTTAADESSRVRIGDHDMRDRAAEYRCFRRGVYPNKGLAGPNPPPWLRHTPYPPYAIPMFALFFEPGGVLQGRLLIELLSLTALVVMGRYGYRELRFAGPAMAVIGSLTGTAIMGNSTVLELGHFSIICMGLIVGQMVLLERGRPVPAGICWALAMIKPHIALAFVPLFLVNRQWRGLLAGCVVLATLGIFACWWTAVPPLRAISQWFVGLSWVFSTRAQGIGPGSLAAWLGLNPQHVHTAMIVLCGCLLAVVCGLFLRRTTGDRGRTSHIAPLAGACAVLGDVFIYHHFYDNVMLFPTAIAILTLAAAVPAWWSVGLATLMMATLWTPHRFVTQVPFNGIDRAAIWLTVAAVLTAFVIDGPAARLLRRTSPALNA